MLGQNAHNGDSYPKCKVMLLAVALTAMAIRMLAKPVATYVTGPTPAVCTYNGREVVICKDHITGFLGNLCASNAHGHSYVGQLQGWCIIHAIPCHGHNVAHVPQQSHYVLQQNQSSQCKQLRKKLPSTQAVTALCPAAESNIRQTS